MKYFKININSKKVSTKRVKQSLSIHQKFQDFTAELGIKI